MGVETSNCGIYDELEEVENIHRGDVGISLYLIRIGFQSEFDLFSHDLGFKLCFCELLNGRNEAIREVEESTVDDAAGRAFGTNTITRGNRCECETNFGSLLVASELDEATASLLFVGTP